MEIDQLIVSLGLARYSHEETALNLGAFSETQLVPTIPSNFYGLAVVEIKFGNILADVFSLSRTHPDANFGPMLITPSVIRDGVSQFLWVEPSKRDVISVISIGAVPSYFQMCVRELLFLKKEHMDLAKLAIWEYMAPQTYGLGIGSGLVMPLMGERQL